MPDSSFVGSLWKGLSNGTHKSVGEDTFSVVFQSLLRTNKDCVRQWFSNFSMQGNRSLGALLKHRMLYSNPNVFDSIICKTVTFPGFTDAAGPGSTC